MRAVIFANASLNQTGAITDHLHPGDWIIAADGGARHCKALGLLPHTAIGDFDSLSEAELQELAAQGVEIIRHPRRKDFTDLELALQLAVERAAGEIVVFAGLGERWDMTLANLLLPAAAHLRGVSIRLVDGAQEITLLCGGCLVHLEGSPGDVVSLIPISGDARGVTTQGLEYPLDNETLYFGATRGVSNVLLAKQAQISLADGLLICTILHSSRPLSI